MKNARSLYKDENFLILFNPHREIFNLICEKPTMNIDGSVYKGLTPSKIVMELYKKENEELEEHLKLIETKTKKNSPKYKEEKDKISKKKKSLLQVVSRKCQTLKKLGLISEISNIEKGGDRRNKYFYPTQLGWDFNKIITEEGFPLIDASKKREKVLKNLPKMMSNRDYIQEYKIVQHSISLKEVLEKLVQEFPDVSKSGIYNIHNMISKQAYNGEEFEIERNQPYLYQDFFDNHFMLEKNQRGKIEDFKHKCSKFWENKNEIFEEMELDINNYFSTEISQSSDIDPMDVNILDWIYKSATYLAQNKNRIFKEYFLNFKLETRVIRGDWGFDSDRRKKGLPIIHIFEHSIGSYNFMRTTTLDENKKIISHLEKKLTEYMKNLEQRPYYKNLNENINLLLEISDLRAEIIDNLKKHLLLPIFPGNCKYINPDFPTSH